MTSVERQLRECVLRAARKWNRTAMTMYAAAFVMAVVSAVTDLERLVFAALIVALFAGVAHERARKYQLVQRVIDELRRDR